MSEEAVDIKVNLKAVSSDVEAKLKSIGEKAKNIGKNPGGSPSTSSNPKSGIRSSGSSAKSSLNQAIYEGKNRGASASAQMGSDLDEGARGGFYNALSSKVDSFRNFGAKKAGSGFGSGSFDSTDGSNGNPESARQKLDKAEFTIQNADFKKIENAKGGSIGNGKGNREWIGPPAPTPSSAPESAGGSDTGKGSIISKIGAGIPIIGGVIAAATAGIMKLVSDVGQRHVSAIMSQSSTFGATGGYVGGGGGLFANESVAQAKVSSARISGKSVFQTKDGIDEQEMKFAASQGRGLSEITDAMAQLRKDGSTKDINYYRGAAKQAGFENLRQSEFLTKIGSMSESMREKGFSGNMESIMSSVVGMKLGEDSDPMRKLSIAESIGEKSRSGIFGGGVTGALALSEALKETGGDFNQAMKLVEGKDGHKYGMNGLNNINESARAFIFKREGHGTYTEGLTAKLQQGKVQSDTSGIDVGINEPLLYKNEIHETFAGETGRKASKIGFEMEKQMLEMFQTMEGTIQGLADTIHSVEKSALTGLGETLKTMAPTLELIAKGDTDALMDKFVEKLKNSFKLM